MMKNIRTLAASIVVFTATAVLVLPACSGEGAVGDECDESGKQQGECESGGICGKNAQGALQCLKVCVDQNQCSTIESCNGVDGSNIKGCRPK